MTQVYIIILDFKVWLTDVKAEKFDRSLLKTFEMVNTSFQVLDKFDHSRFF